MVSAGHSRLKYCGLFQTFPGMRFITAAWDFHDKSRPTTICGVDVTVGVPKPEAVNRQAVLETLPHGGDHINVTDCKHSMERAMMVG
jgi:hypothetical protein